MQPGSRWARLADRRAAELLAGAAGDSPAVVESDGGFPCRVRGQVSDGPASCVVDTARPEDPADHLARLDALVDACAPGGTVVLVACGGAAAGTGPLAPRTLDVVRSRLIARGCPIERLVAFDALGATSPWRLALGARTDAVLAEMDAHLASPSVRVAARLVERHVIAALAPSQTARVLVVARRDAVPAAVVPEPDPHAALHDPALAAAALPLLHDDAVVRWLAFLDAELSSLPGLGFDLLGWVRGLADDPAREADVRALLRARGRWWQRDLEVQRLCEAASHRFGRRVVAELARLPLPDGVPCELAATLEYEVVALFNETIDGFLREGGTR